MDFLLLIYRVHLCGVTSSAWRITDHLNSYYFVTAWPTAVIATGSRAPNDDGHIPASTSPSVLAISSKPA
jgi:hypothetical protein